LLRESKFAVLVADLSENSEAFSRQNSSGFFLLVGGKRNALHFASLSSVVGSSAEYANTEAAPRHACMKNVSISGLILLFRISMLTRERQGLGECNV
jgi:hypothetical protein